MLVFGVKGILYFGIWRKRYFIFWYLADEKLVQRKSHFPECYQEMDPGLTGYSHIQSGE